MLKRLTELLDRHKLLEDMRQAEERALSEEELNEEQDEIIATLFCFVRDKLPELKRVHSTLEKVQSVIECTYGHKQNDDSTDGERDDSEPEFSSADIVDFLCEIEGIVDESLQSLGDTDAPNHPDHIVCVYDAPSGNEALYKNGQLFDSDFTMYASDVARAAAGDAPVNVSELTVALPPEIEWTQRIDDLLKYETEED